MGRASAVPDHHAIDLTNSAANPRLLAGFRTTARVSSLIAAGTGLAVLSGWALDVKALQTVFPGLASMKPLTALSFVLLGVSLWLQMLPTISARQRALVVGCAALAAAIGLINLAEYVFNWNPGFDLLLFPKRLAAEPGAAFPGRMSAATALCAALIGGALVLQDTKQIYLKWAVGPLAYLTGVIALVALVGYAYGAQSLYQIFPYASMALHTAALFLILAIGTAAARPERGITAILASDSAGGAALRRLLPAGLILPIAAGWLRLIGQQIGLYDTNFGLAIFALSNVLIFAALVTWNGRRLHIADLDRREGMKSVRESEGRFQTVIETTPNGVVAIDAEGRMVMVNTMAATLFGYSQLELIAQPMEMLLPERFRTGHTKFRTDYFSDPSPRSMGIGRDLAGRRKDGAEFPVEIGLSFTKTREGPLALAFITDITERKVAELEVLALNAELEQRVEERTAELEASERKFYKAFASSPAGISIATQADGRWIEVNDALTQMTGYSREEMIGHTSAELGLVDTTAREKILEATRQHGMVRSVEVRVRTKSGEMTDVLLSTEQIDLAGQPCVLSIQYDISKRKRAEAQIALLNKDLMKRQSDLQAANKELEAFSYSVSHDLRAPLRAVDGFSRIIEEDYSASLDAEGVRYLGLVRDNVRHMGRLIDDLLAFARLGRQQIAREKVDMNLLARDTLSKLPDDEARKANVHIGDLPEADADPALLRQVLANLLENAIKFTRDASPPHIEVGHETQDGETVYFVRDNGAGFDMQYEHKLFGVFHRLHRVEDFEGTGVGLAICQRVVQRHGGRIWADAAVGKGATFFFTIGRETGNEPTHEEGNSASRGQSE